MEQEISQKDLEAKLNAEPVKLDKDGKAKLQENIAKAGSDVQWLGVGIHEVSIDSVELTESKSGTLGIRFGVSNDEGVNRVTMWLSSAALPYTIENVARIIIHNVEDAKKDEVRKTMAGITSAKDLYTIAKAKMVGYKAWLQVSESKTRTYTDRQGNERPSLEQRLLGYEPKPKLTPVSDAVSAVKDVIGGGDNIDLSSIPF